MRVLWIPLLAAASLQAQSGSIAGVVSDQAGKPLAGVHVRLITGDFNSQGGIDAVYGARTDQAGQFSVERMKPGLYILMAEHTGYVQAAGPTTPMGFATAVLKPGQHVAGFRLVLTAQAVIAGRVVDEFGDPVPEISVRLQPASPQQNSENPFGNSSSATDDRGEFRIATAPGRYYLKAQVFASDREEIRTDGTAGGSFHTTFYPSAANPGAASVVQVAAGQEAAGFEIRLQRASTGTGTAGSRYKVRGTVTGAPDNGEVTILLRLMDSAGDSSNSLTSNAGAGGEFFFPDLEPGSYRVLAYYSKGKTPLQSRAVDFQIEAADRTGIQLALAPGEELIGALELTGDAASRTVRLDPMGWSEMYAQEDPPSAAVSKDGSFHLTGILPAKYRLVVEPLPENGYVQEIALDGKPVVNGELDFTQGVGGSRIKVTVSRGGAQISGSVLDAAGDPAIGMVMVFFGGNPKELDDDSALRVSDGKYLYKGIRPGKYRLFAIDIAEMLPVLAGGGNEEEIMHTLFDAAPEIEIKEGDRISKDIPAWTKVPAKKGGQ